MNKKFKYSNLGMNQDVSNSKFSNQYAFENKNIRIIATDSQSTASVINDKGNEFKLALPQININYITKVITYGNKTLTYTTNDINYPDQPGTQLIIGNAIGKTSIILFSTDNNFDCVWELKLDTFDLTLLYIRKLTFSTNHPIQALINYENDKIEKVYWVDGANQMRFLNIKQSIANGFNDDIIDIESSLINVVGNFKFSQPVLVSKEQGGSHTAGMIQYAYVLYKLNGAATKLSPLSELISLDNGELGGGKVNETVSFYPVINIPFIDSDYTNMRLYSIKYTSYNELPEINLILDRNIQGLDDLTFYDVGNKISTVSTDEFTFLSNNIVYIPKHINTKFNRLFSANYKEKVFDVKLDTRAYSFELNQEYTQVYDELTYDSINDIIIGNNVFNTTPPFNTVPEKHNCLNKDFDSYTYQYNSNIIGGTGRYLSWELFRSEIGVDIEDVTKTQSEGKFFKDREIYRLGIQFYNRKAQISLPKWITDFKTTVVGDENNINGFYATLKVKFNSDFFVWLNDQSNFLDENNVFDEDLKPVGFKLLRAERTNGDRSIICQGLLNGLYAIKNTTDEPNRYLSSPSDKDLYVHNTAKCPSMMRPFDASIGPLRGMNSYQNVDRGRDDLHPDIKEGTILGVPTGENGGQRQNAGSEIYNSVSSADIRSTVYQFNQLMTMYSPEVTFNQIQKLENVRLNAIGVLENDTNNFWGKLINTETLGSEVEAKVYGHLTPYSRSVGGSIDYPTDPNSNTPPPLVSPAVYQAYVDSLVLDHNTTYGVYASDVPLYIPTIEEYSASLLNNTITPSDNINGILGDPYTFGSWGLIAPQGVGDDYRSASYQPQYQFYRSYLGSLNYSNNDLDYKVYGNPLIVETGANRTIYNKDTHMSFYNTFSIMNTDSGETSENSPNWRVSYMNSWGARTAILALGENTDDTENRTELQDIFQDLTGIIGYDPWDYIIPDFEGKVGVLSELTLHKSSIYLGLLYGGNDFESRKRTNYIEIGEYRNLVPDINNEFEYHCKNGGDTFIYNFRFTKIVKTNTQVIDLQVPQFTEILDFKVETNIDLKNRTDYSLEDWDSRFQPRYEEYQNYNRVYSQESNFFVRRDVDYNFNAVSKFENGIIVSSIKTPGEFIDSWLNYLPNEVMYIDGKHGAINCLHSYKDELYALQDRAIAALSIIPRVQVQGNDGIAIQLGTGGILDRYQYVTTMSGTLNKWSVTNSSNGFYYYDHLNKAIQFNSNKISDVKGMHSYLINHTQDTLKTDNPILRNGVISTYDYLNNELVFTFLQEGDSFTFIFNEGSQSFTSFYDYLPSMYISVNDVLLSTHPNNNEIYQQGIGEYNKYFGIYYPSYIIYNLNPEPDTTECIFDNINFKSECYLNNIDQDLITINNIQCYNDYQDSGLIPLINGRNSNLRRKFRDWNAFIPKEGRTRIRGPFAKLKLQFNNTNNYKLIVHDILLDYTV